MSKLINNSSLVNGGTLAVGFATKLINNGILTNQIGSTINIQGYLDNNAGATLTAFVKVVVASAVKFMPPSSSAFLLAQG